MQEYDRTYHTVVQRVTWGIASPVEYDVPKCGPGVMGCNKEVLFVHSHLTALPSYRTSILLPHTQGLSHLTALPRLMERGCIQLPVPSLVTASLSTPLSTAMPPHACPLRCIRVQSAPTYVIRRLVHFSFFFF